MIDPITAQYDTMTWPAWIAVVCTVAVIYITLRVIAALPERKKSENKSRMCALWTIKNAN